jgi:hypothetical protein
MGDSEKQALSEKWTLKITSLYFSYLGRKLEILVITFFEL